MLLSKAPQLDIVSVFKRYNFDLKESGNRYVCLCPFHDDKNTPNLTIYPETDSFYCFTCKKSGDALTLISFMEKIPIYEVKKKLGTDYLRYSLNRKIGRNLDFFQTLLKDSSVVFFNYLKAYPGNQDYVLQCMQQFDEYLEKLITDKVRVDFKLYTTILDNLKKLLYNK